MISKKGGPKWLEDVRDVVALARRMLAITAGCRVRIAQEPGMEMWRK